MFGGSIYFVCSVQLVQSFSYVLSYQRRPFRNYRSPLVHFSIYLFLLQLSADVSGRGAETKVRGRLKEKEREEQRKKEANEITEQVKEKYSRWSKG